MYRDTQERWKNTLNGLQTTMQMQAQASQNLSDDEGVLADLVGKSQSAVGALQAMQAMNQLLALQAKQSIQTQRLSITQDRAASLELARQAAAVERGREVNRRFLGEGRAHLIRRFLRPVTGAVMTRVPALCGFVLLLAGCGQQEEPSVDALSADPSRLRAQEQCRAGQLDDASCAQVAQADLRRFLSARPGQMSTRRWPICRRFRQLR